MSLRDHLFYEEPGITLYCGDCREVLPLLTGVCSSYCLEECSGRCCEPRYDLVLTDPPYGLGERWQGGAWGANAIYADARGWDRPLEPGLITHITALGRNAVVWGGNYYTLPPSRGWLAWVKSSPMATLADFELAWTNADRPAKAFTEDRNPDGKREHPTQKPLSLMLWCLKLFDGETVFDPFCGSGVTLEAAKNLGRRAIGIEIEPKYCEIAVKRLRQEVLAFPT